MPTDATGTPTTLGIPTFNVDADAPSGLGFNEAMTEIDALIAARLLPNGSPTSGQVLEWDGSHWTPTTLTLPGEPDMVTSLPGSPTDKEVVLYTDSTSAPTFVWRLVYYASASAWVFTGGSWKEGTTSVTVPLAGAYYTEIGGDMSGNAWLTLTAGGISLQGGGNNGGGGTETVMASVFDKGKMTGLTASQVLTPSVSGTVTRAYIRVQPVVVS